MRASLKAVKRQLVRRRHDSVPEQRFIRTLKEQRLWVEYFETVEDLRQALLAFKERYNEHWLIERHGHMSPAEKRRILEQKLQAAA